MSDDLRLLIVDLEKATRKDVDARKLLQVEAENAKKDWQQQWSDFAGAIAWSVTYDTEDTRTGAKAEIGPDKDKRVGGGPHATPGNLGNIVEFGSSRHGPIRPVTKNVLESAAERLERYLGDLGSEIL